MASRRSSIVLLAIPVAFLSSAGCADVIGMGPLAIMDDDAGALAGDDASPQPSAPARDRPEAGAPIDASVDGDAPCVEKATGFVAPSIVVTAGGGNAWGWLDAAKTQDDVAARAVANLCCQTSNDTQSLVALGFGFAIPERAVIHGVDVEIRVRQGFGPANGTRDKTVALLPSGSANQKSAVPYTSTFATRSYGGNGPRWGMTLTPAIVNAPTFGLSFQSTRAIVPSATSVEVDVVRMNVAYCE